MEKLLVAVLANVLILLMMIIIHGQSFDNCILLLLCKLRL